MSLLKDRFPDALTITADHLMHHVRQLTTPAMRGRMPGDVGYDRACSYVAAAFTQLGLAPLGDEGAFRQAFTLETNRIVSAKVALRHGTGDYRQLELGRDFVCRGLTGKGKIQGELAFVGYGQNNEQLNELDGIELEGKIALSFKHPAPWMKDRPADLPRAKAHRVKERGAIGLAIVPNPNRDQRDQLSASLIEELEPLPDFPMIVLAEHVATPLFEAGDQTLSSLQYQSDAQQLSVSGPVPGALQIDLETEWQRNGICWNVIGALRGSDPELNHEAIVIGAHLDHVGIQGESVIFPGAQDDASGVAAVLAMAAAFQRLPRPRRTLIFIAFGAEETGIHGSTHYGAHPAWPLEHTKAMLNLDCMGAGIGLDVRGRKHHPQLFSVLDEINERWIHVPDTLADHGAGGADAEPFQRAGVPNMFIVSQLPYQHLHMATDTSDTLNPSLFESITRLAFLTALELAERPSQT